MGWGEVDGCPLVTKAVIDAGYSHTRVNDLRNILLGEDPLDTARLWNKMHQSNIYFGRGGTAIRLQSSRVNDGGRSVCFFR
jgi:L-rhamnonate dehydratase